VSVSSSFTLIIAPLRFPLAATNPDHPDPTRLHSLLVRYHHLGLGFPQDFFSVWIMMFAVVVVERKHSGRGGGVSAAELGHDLANHKDF